VDLIEEKNLLIIRIFGQEPVSNSWGEKWLKKKLNPPTKF